MVAVVVASRVAAVRGAHRGVNDAARGQVGRHRVGVVGRHRDGVEAVGVGCAGVDRDAITGGRRDYMARAHGRYVASVSIAIVIIFNPQPVTDENGWRVGVVRRVGVCHHYHRPERRRAGDRRRVGIGANHGRAGQHTGHARMRCQFGQRTGHTAFDVVAQGHVGQGHVARVTDGVGPGYWVTHGNRHTGCGVRIHPVGGLNHVNRRRRLEEAEVDAQVVRQGHDHRCPRAVVVAVVVASRVAAIRGAHRGVNDAARGQAGCHGVGVVGGHRDGVEAVGVGCASVDSRAIAGRRCHHMARTHGCYTASVSIAIVIIFDPQPVTDEDKGLTEVMAGIRVGDWRVGRRQGWVAR